MTDKDEVRNLAQVLRNCKYFKLPPEELATHLLTNGFSRTAVAFDHGMEQGQRFEAAVNEALGLVE